MKYLILAASLIATPAMAQDVFGSYQTEPGDTGGYLIVNIGACGDRTCGTIQQAISADGEVISDYEHLGKPIIWDMQQTAQNKWSKGKIWAPDRDKTYASRMTLNGNTLKVSGCVAGLLCRSQNWQKLQ